MLLFVVIVVFDQFGVLVYDPRVFVLDKGLQINKLNKFAVGLRQRIGIETKFVFARKDTGRQKVRNGRY